MLKYRIHTGIILLLIALLSINFEDNILLIGVILFIHVILCIIGAFDIRQNFYIRSFNHLKTEYNEVIITFDDGPNEHTNDILELLEEYKVKACFFIIGKNIKKNETTITRIKNAGHSIGNHSYYHRNTFPLQSTKKILKEITKTNQELSDIIEEDVLFFRPPFGVTNPLIYNSLKKTNLLSIGWSIRSFDTLDKPKEIILSNMIKRIKKGSIILLHDSGKNTLWILQELLNHLKNDNYKVVNLKEVLTR